MEEGNKLSVRVRYLVLWAIPNIYGSGYDSAVAHVLRPRRQCGLWFLLKCIYLYCQI